MILAGTDVFVSPIEISCSFYLNGSQCKIATIFNFTNQNQHPSVEVIYHFNLQNFSIHLLKIKLKVIEI